MLFILRQIREASDPEIDPAAVALQRAPREQEYEEPAVNFPRVPVRVAPVIIPDPASLGDITRRRVPEQFGVLFWSIVLVAGLAWNFLIVMSRWRDKFASQIGVSAPQVPASDAWYDNLDRFSVLLWWEFCSSWASQS